MPDTASEHGSDPPARLGDRYELLGLLGRGGMAEVFRARDHALDRVVAVKVLPAGRRGESDVARLRDEARAAAGVSHPHVIAVHDVGTSDDGVFVVMELLDGSTWREELRERGPDPEAVVARRGAQVASALAAAHTHGVLHRDVNPANVMIQPDGTAKLMDFGIARIEEGGGLTQTGSVVGTPAYMAPEQVRGDALDGRCDVYSLACTLYEAATGRPPFAGVGSADTASARLRETPIPPRQLRPGLSVGFEDVLMRAMALEPHARPDARTLTAELSALADGGPGSAREPDREPDRDPPRPTAVLPADASRPEEGTTERLRSAERPPPDAPPPGSGLRRAGTVLVAVGILAIVVLALWLVVR